MMEWIIVTISSNPVISIGIGILIIAAYLFGQGKSGSPPEKFFFIEGCDSLGKF